MTWQATITGHVANAGLEQEILSEVEQFVVDLLEGFDAADTVISLSFSGLYIGHHNPAPVELMEKGAKRVATTEELQQLIDDKAVEMNAENLRDVELDDHTGGTNNA